MFRRGSIRARSDRARAYGAWMVLAVALAPSSTLARDANAPEVRVAWEPSAGAVDAYVVFVSRDGGPYRSEQYTREPSVRIAGRPGETVQVRVRAYAATERGPRTSAVSEASEPIRFPAAAAPPAAPAEGEALPAARARPAEPLALGAPPARARALPVTDFAPPLSIRAGGDFDGDGYPDLLATLGAWDHPLVLFQREGGLGRVASLAPFTGASAAAGGDLDGDGRDELFVKTADGVAVFRIDASGKTTLVRREALPADGRFAVVDLDGDDEASLVTYEPASGRLSERLTRGEPTDFGVVRPLFLLLGGDFDGNGRDDLYLQARAGGDAELWLMQEGRRFETAPLQLDANVANAAVLDWNGDGRADLVGYDASRREVRVWLLDGARVVERRTLAPGPVESLRVLDLDGDERQDLLLSAPGGAATALLSTP